MSKDKPALIPASTKSETILDIASFVSSAVPWIGGPVSNVLSGLSWDRKLVRIKECLEGIVSDLSKHKDEISEQYVKTEEFEELLAQTLKRVADERRDEKRRVYRAFLTDTIESPGKSFDEQIRFLRTFEELQPDHFKVLRALSQSPTSNPDQMGSPIETLHRRMPELDKTHIEDLITQLNDLRVTKMTSLKTMMTGYGAEDLSYSITPYGKRLLQYIVNAEN